MAQNIGILCGIFATKNIGVSSGVKWGKDRPEFDGAPSNSEFVRLEWSGAHKNRLFSSFTIEYNRTPHTRKPADEHEKYTVYINTHI